MDYNLVDQVEDWDSMVELEVHGVRKLNKVTPYEEYVVSDTSPQWYSVYARHNDGWSVCVSNNTSKLQSIELLVHLQVAYPHLRKGRHSLGLSEGK